MSVKHATPGTLDVDTAHGLARVRLHPADQPLAALVLGHGAAGGVTAPDLKTATDAAHPLGFSVALVEQPYRVAARRSPPPAQRLDRGLDGCDRAPARDRATPIATRRRRAIIRRPRGLPDSDLRPARSGSSASPSPSNPHTDPEPHPHRAAFPNSTTSPSPPWSCKARETHSAYHPPTNTARSSPSQATTA